LFQVLCRHVFEEKENYGETTIITDDTVGTNTKRVDGRWKFVSLWTLFLEIKA